MTEQTAIVLLLAVLVLSWASIAVVVVFIGMRILRILHEVETLAVHLKNAGNAAAVDIAELRSRLREEGSKLRGIADAVLGFALRKASSRRHRLKRPARSSDEGVEDAI